MLKNSSYDEKFMHLALESAKKSGDDIPVCAIIVKNNEIIALEVNRREKDNLTTSHAEILAIQAANKKLNSWRLSDCDIYVTLEPCPMCAWAILSSRIKNLYFASSDTKYGAFGGALNLNLFSDYKINVFGGFLENESDEILQKYFGKMRK